MNPPLDTHQPHQGAPRIGYVLKVYPRFSETFIVTEILAREAQGEDLSIYALRPTTDARFHPEIARVAARVNWVGRPNRAIDLWSQLTEGLTCQEDRERFAAIMPVLADLPGDEVAQGVELARQARRDSITHLHAHFASLAGRVAWIASALTGIPYTVTTHAKDIFHESVDPVWLRRICADAQRVIAISRYNEDYLGTVLAGTGATVSLRYNALELDRFSYRAPQPVSATRAEPLRVCAVGRLVPKKGFADLVEAVRILVSSGIDVEVELAGDGDERERLTEQIERLGLADRIRLLARTCSRRRASRRPTAISTVCPRWSWRRWPAGRRWWPRRCRDFRRWFTTASPGFFFPRVTRPRWPWPCAGSHRARWTSSRCRAVRGH